MPHTLLENVFQTFGFNSRSAQTSGHHSRLFHSGGVALSFREATREPQRAHIAFFTFTPFINVSMRSSTSAL